MISLRKSLTSKLSLSILLLAMPIFVLSLGVLFLQSRYMLRVEAMGRANSVLNTTMQRVRRYMNAVETGTNANEWFVLHYLQPDSLLTVTHRIVRMNPHVNGCSVTTEPYMFPQYGRYFSAYSIREGDSIITVREAEYEYFDKVWYKMPQTLGEACWTDPFDDFNEGTLYTTELIASYCKPLYLDDGRFVGVLSSDLSLSKLAETINKEPPYPNSYFTMIGSDGHYFIHPDSTRLYSNTIFTDTDPHRQSDLIALGHEMTAGKQGNMRVYIDGAPCLVCYQPVPGTSWSLALVCPDKDILHGYHQLTYIIVPLLVIGLIVILLFCRRTVAHAISPLGKLIQQTQNIAAGNYEVHIRRSERIDAVGRLQNSFARMLQSLNFHMGSIRYTAGQTKLRNEELAKATQMAEEADRQKTTFIHNVTHQIRTPLNIIMGFAQVLRDSSSLLPEDDMKNIADMMNYNAMTLNRMVLMLFDSSDTGLSKELAESHRHDEVQCNKVVLECIEYTLKHFPKVKIDFETEVPDTFCIHTNHLYLMRTLREILYNSAKYSDGQHVRVIITQTETTVRFTFEDTGPGMSEDYIGQMFTSFTKVNDLSEGLGLGLSLSKRHALTLGGDLTFDADYHDGCRFVVELPKV